MAAKALLSVRSITAIGFDHRQCAVVHIINSTAFVKFTTNSKAEPTHVNSLRCRLDKSRVERDRTIQTTSQKAGAGKSVTTRVRVGLGTICETDAIAGPPLPGIDQYGSVTLMV